MYFYSNPSGAPELILQLRPCEDELKAAQSRAMDTGNSDLHVLSFACLSLPSAKPKPWLQLPRDSGKLQI